MYSNEWERSQVQLRVLILKSDIPVSTQLQLTAIVDKNMDKSLQEFLMSPGMLEIKASLGLEQEELSASGRGGNGDGAFRDDAELECSMAGCA